MIATMFSDDSAASVLGARTSFLYLSGTGHNTCLSANMHPLKSPGNIERINFPAHKYIYQLRVRHDVRQSTYLQLTRLFCLKISRPALS